MKSEDQGEKKECQKKDGFHYKIKIKHFNQFIHFLQLLVDAQHTCDASCTLKTISCYAVFLIVTSIIMNFQVIFVAQNLPTFTAQFFFPLCHVGLQTPVSFKGFATKFAFLRVSLVMSCKIKKGTEANIANFTIVLPSSIFIVSTTCLSFHAGSVLE